MKNNAVLEPVSQYISTLNKIELIPLSQLIISPTNPRKTFNPEKIISIGNDIKQNGLMHPIPVRKTSKNKYEIVVGSRRFRGFTYLAESDPNYDAIPAFVRELTDANEMTLEAHNKFLKRAMKLTLKFFENTICERRMYILNAILIEGRTCKDIGLELGLTAERVRQLYEKSLIRLESEIESTESLATQIQVANKATMFIDSVYHDMMLDVEYKKPELEPFTLELPEGFDMSILDITVESLKDQKDIGLRLYNSLTRISPRLLTIKDIALNTSKMLRKRSNFGIVQLYEIRALLESYGLKLIEQ